MYMQRIKNNIYTNTYVDQDIHIDTDKSIFILDYKGLYSALYNIVDLQINIIMLLCM